MNIQNKRQKLSVPRNWGHEQFLKELIGKMVGIGLNDDGFIRGKLLHFDRYTILIEQDGEERLIFKSAIESIAKDEQ